MAQKKGLGRGLNDLLGTSDASRSPKPKKTTESSSSSEKEVKTVTKEVIKEVVKEVVNKAPEAKVNAEKEKLQKYDEMMERVNLQLKQMEK